MFWNTVGYIFIIGLESEYFSFCVLRSRYYNYLICFLRFSGVKGIGDEDVNERVW